MLHKPLHPCNDKGETPYPEEICWTPTLSLVTSALCLFFAPNLLVGYKNDNIHIAMYSQPTSAYSAEVGKVLPFSYSLSASLGRQQGTLCLIHF